MMGLRWIYSRGSNRLSLVITEKGKAQVGGTILYFQDGVINRPRLNRKWHKSNGGPLACDEAGRVEIRD